MSIKQIFSSTALIATDYPELFDDDNTTNTNNSSKITLFSKNILPTTLTDNNYKDLYNNITTTVDDPGILDEVENENFNDKSEEYNQGAKEKQHIISGYYNFHINANLVNGLVGGGGSVSGSSSSSSYSNSNNRYNNVMNAGIFQNNGGLFFHQGQYNSMRSSLGTSNSSLHGNVNILLGGAMLSVVITVLCVVCYCCHRNIKKRTESAYRQRWLENDPNMEIYSVEQCYETSGLFMDSDETLANQVPPLSHQPPPSYDAVVAMDEMIIHRTSPPPGYRSTTSITSNNNAIKYIDFQQQPSTSSSSTAASIHHQHHRHHNHDIQQHNNRITSQLQLPNHYRHRPSLGKCPSLRNYNHHRSFGNKQPGTYEKNYHFRMLRTESCCSLERALGGCRISAMDSSSSSNGSILEDENISLPPNIHSRLAVNNSSTSSKLNTPSIPSTSVGSDYDHNCPLCGKFRNYSNCSNLNENLHKFNMKLTRGLNDKNMPETTAKLNSNTIRINNHDYTGREHELNENTLKINNSPIASGSSARTSSSSSSSSQNLSHTCECNSINSQQLPLSENSTNLTSLTIPSTSITDETNTSYLTEFFEADQMMDTNQDEINSEAPLVRLVEDNNDNNNNTNNNSNNNINDLINNNNGSHNMSNITNSNNNLINVINDCVNNNNNFNEDYQSSAESLQQQVNKNNCNNSANNISNYNSNNNINETVINQNTDQLTACQSIMATSSVNGFNNNNNNNNNNIAVTCSNSIDSIDSINGNGIIRLDMSQMIDRTGLPTYDAAIKLQSSGYV